MPVEICFRSSEHLVKHMRLCLGYQTFQQGIGHWDIDSDARQDFSGIQTCCNQYALPLVDIVRGNHLADFSADDAQLSDRFSGNEGHPKPSCHLVVSKRCGQRIRMSVCRTPACTDNFIRKIRIDSSYLIPINHSYIKSHSSCTVCQTGKYFPVLFVFSKSQIAVLMILAVHLQFLGERRPEIFDSVHDQRKLPDITAGLPDTAAVS